MCVPRYGRLRSDSYFARIFYNYKLKIEKNEIICFVVNHCVDLVVASIQVTHESVKWVHGSDKRRAEHIPLVSMGL